MTGTTGLKNLRVDCIIGIYPHERAATQTVYLDIQLDYDFAAPAACRTGPARLQSTQPFRPAAMENTVASLCTFLWTVRS